MKNINNEINSKKIGLIIFARMSSKRYPGKVLEKIYNNNNVFEIILNNLKKEQLHSKIIIATSKNKIDKKIVNFCKTNNIKFFLGNHNNVFLRTKQCIKKYNLNYFVRICADRPFFDVSLMKKMIKLMFQKEVDIVTNAYPRTYPKGLTCEVARANIFRKTKQSVLSKDEKEHIFDYFYKKKKYKIYNLKSNFNKNFLNKNFSIDKKKDIKKIKKIFIKFTKMNKIINTSNLYKVFSK
jgi:spore coat polysaccharide biosynthesis protein SpsF (cytidylyltransferase family)